MSKTRKFITIDDIIIPISIRPTPEFREKYNIPYNLISGTITLAELQDALAYFVISQEEQKNEQS